MNKLQSEWHRLYIVHTPEGQGSDAGLVRAMVLELAGPADWEALLKVWQGVQVDLNLPAPAIAVSGIDGYQLWFSLSDPWPSPKVMAFLESLRGRYLGDIAPERVGLMLAMDAPVVPAIRPETGYWSAFVAADLAPVFADTPWLDIPPSADGQADVLSRLASIKKNDFERALERLKPVMAAATGPTMSQECLDPKRFLRDVMNNEAVELRLRIEAAKALLPYV